MNDHRMAIIKERNRPGAVFEEHQVCRVCQICPVGKSRLRSNATWSDEFVPDRLSRECPNLPGHIVDHLTFQVLVSVTVLVKLFRLYI